MYTLSKNMTDTVNANHLMIADAMVLDAALVGVVGLMVETSAPGRGKTDFCPKLQRKLTAG